MEKVWLRSYPAGMPPEIDVAQFASIRDLFERACRRFGPLPAFSGMGGRITYDELDRASRDFAAWLQKEVGLARGDRVAIMLPNLLQYPVAMFGVLRAGLTVVNVNPLYTPRELEHQLHDSGASAILVLENFAHTLQQALAGPSMKGSPLRAIVTTRVGDLLPAPMSVVTNFVVKYVKGMVPAWSLPGAVGLGQALERGRRHALERVEIGREDIAFLQYTGGTTGVPKGAVLTHGNIVSDVLQTSRWIAGILIDGEETIVAPLPLYHILSLVVSLLCVNIGAHGVLIANPRDFPAFLKELSRHRFTGILGVNTLFNALLDAPGFRQLLASRSLKFAFGGGAPIQRAVAQRWKELTGVPLIEGYGLTETSAVVTVNPFDDADHTGTVGLPVPSTEVAILDDEGRELPPGEVGEIGIRGPQVMPGYWNRPDETAKVMTPEGWFRTGDIGRFDERGYLHIVDRKKDMILVSGFNVYPSEIEDVVMMHPGVAEVGCVGVPDDKTGEAVKIFVVRRDVSLDADALIRHCRERMTAYKVPRHVEFRDQLPKSPIGKVLRRVLRDEELARQRPAEKQQAAA